MKIAEDTYSSRLFYRMTIVGRLWIVDEGIGGPAGYIVSRVESLYFPYIFFRKVEIKNFDNFLSCVPHG